MYVAIIGTGYVGLVTAAGLAECGHDVTCVDIDKEKIHKLSRGECTIYESDLPQLLHKNMSRIVFTTDGSSGYRSADIIIVAVGTPERKDGSANLKYVYSAVDDIISVRKKAVVIMKSTVPIGTNDRLERYVKSKGAEIEFVSNPEFLSQGTAVRDMLHPNRIVIGTKSENAKQVISNLYKGFDAPIVYTDRNSAEMIKYAANDFLALKISYINEIANLCEKVGANVEDVALGIGYDSRIGSQFLRPGVGYGGSCFPKDTKALHWLAGFNDCELKTVKAAIEVNANQKLLLIKKARKYYEDFNNLTIAVLGLAFKPGTDDLREAPALDNIPLLLDEGARVRVWDPQAAEKVKAMYPAVEVYSSIEDALRGADLCLIFTEWDEVKSLTLDSIKLMHEVVVIDGRNCFPVEQIASSIPIIYESIGRPVVNSLWLKSNSLAGVSAN